MSYQALYRTYRPRTFEDVVGQSHITQTLQNAISMNKFSHAYLFSGPRGTGKTSAAKIFAQTINCEKMPTTEPCNECASCRGILDGTIQDVIEIDAASNTSVDDIRDIREKVKYASSVVPYKVYIIDEVHMISVNAFNALLKTLEEPPAHVVFILATTEPHKIPLTIISRCQRFDFKPIHNKVMMERMKQIVQTESVEVTDSALEQIALAAEGGMRDALSLLDQTISYSDGKIDIEDVLTVTGSVSQDVFIHITTSMFEKNAEEMLRQFDALIANGKDPSRFVFDYIYFLRDLLFYKTTTKLEEHLERAIVTEEFQQLAGQIEMNWIQEAMKELTTCEQQIKWTTSPKVFVEVTLLMIANKKSENKVVEQAIPVNEIQQLQERITNLEEQLKDGQQIDTSSTAAKQQRKKQPTKQESTFKIPTEKIYDVLDRAGKAEIVKIRQEWASFLEQLKVSNPQAHATIQHTNPAAAANDAVVVSFKYEIHCSLFMNHRNLAESILANILSNHVQIIPIPEENWLQIRENYIQEKGTSQPNVNVEEEKSEEPLEHVEKAQELFGEEIIEIKD